MEKSVPTWRVCLEILGAAFRLGCTSFGGPIAHLGYFRQEYVLRKKWLDDKTYADIVALCQALPGPASSQVGIAIGMMRGGLPGAVASWLGFTLPSALALMVVAGVFQGVDIGHAGWIRGLLIVAVVVVAHAIWGMARTLTPDNSRKTMALLAAAISLTAQTPLTQIIVIIGGAVVGWLLFRNRPSNLSGESADESSTTLKLSGHKTKVTTGVVAWIVFCVLFVVLPIMSHIVPGPEIAVFDSFYRVGSLVFGGGHVVLPLLATEVVGPGWLTEDTFLSGYGAAQAVPGPLFTFAAYLGMAIGGWHLGIIGLVAIFTPSFLIVTGTLPFWDVIRRKSVVQAVLRGVNAVVVGILLAAFYDPIWTKGIQSSADFGLALVAFGLLGVWKVPAWAVVIVTALGGILLY